jgi:hypothetical protein
MDNTGKGATRAAGGDKATAMPWGKPNANRAPPLRMGDVTPTAARRATGIAQEISARGYSSPKDKGDYKPVSGKIQQLHQYIGDPHSVKQTSHQFAYATKLYNANRQLMHLLEHHFGAVFQGKVMPLQQRACAKGRRDG